ncbi:MAG: class I SAM-dependent methyltransferase [Granulosicoccus sp.]
MAKTSDNSSPTERFSDRVRNYALYRPSYPQAAIEWLVAEYHLGEATRIADVGSGTGIFSSLLLSNGLSVVAVEPNDEMRQESDRVHLQNSLYSSVSGRAEETFLASDSMDVIVAAQAFHWFNSVKSKKEFLRVLSPGGVLVLVWNKREKKSQFQSEYEGVLGTLPEYSKVTHTRLSDTDISDFFSDDMKHSKFPNSQEFDYEGFRGRVFSSSYTPNENEECYREFSNDIDDLFNRYSNNGLLSFSYTTEIFSGPIE